MELEKTNNSQNPTLVDESTEETTQEHRRKSGFDHTVRHKDNGTITIKNYNIQKAVKLYCSECCGFESDPRDCLDHLCPLYPYRGYTMLNRTRAVFKNNASPEHLAKMRTARLEKINHNKE